MKSLRPYDPDENRRMLILMMLIGVGLLAWHFVFEAPRQRVMQQKHMVEKQREMTAEKEREKMLEARQEPDRKQALEQAAKQPKIRIETPLVEGAIALQGGRINYLKLHQYKQTIDPKSEDVVLLQPAGGLESYFIEFGWLSNEGGVTLPDNNTVWQATRKTLTPEQPVTLFWENGQGLRFETEIAVKDDYLFGVKQRVVNQSDKQVSVVPYGFINRTFEGKASEYLILHEGPLGVWDNSLHEVSYEELREDGKIGLDNAKGWVGITDKYWLTALIPHGGQTFTGQFKAYLGNDGTHRYQADYMGKSLNVAKGETASAETLVFAGAKQLRLLDRLSLEYNIPLFDRAVDLGVLYFLTKPLFILLNWLYAFAGDFGMAIILLTVLIKAAMYPLANKSYVAMNEMKRLQPKIGKLKERHGDDRVAFNQEMMKLYKKEKINPAAGCLPLLVQIPVFFALYKVLFVTLEMRHANFYGIIKDLSAPDPTNIFTLFGLVEWTPPSILHLGVMAIIMALTMWGQQQLNPKPTDPVQAKVMAWLPWVFMFILAGFPAGLLLYWIWSNLLSIAQQWSIKTRYNRREKKRGAAGAANDA